MEEQKRPIAKLPPRQLESVKSFIKGVQIALSFNYDRDDNIENYYRLSNTFNWRVLLYYPLRYLYNYYLKQGNTELQALTLSQEDVWILFKEVNLQQSKDFLKTLDESISLKKALQIIETNAIYPNV